MDILTFIETFKKELSFSANDPSWTFEKGQEWLSAMHEKTAVILPDVKRSYFLLSHEYISAQKFEDLHSLFPLNNLMLASDENELLDLAVLATSSILTINNQQNMEWALNYLYVLLD